MAKTPALCVYRPNVNIYINGYSPCNHRWQSTSKRPGVNNSKIKKKQNGNLRVTSGT